VKVLKQEFGDESSSPSSRAPTRATTSSARRAAEGEPELGRVGEAELPREAGEEGAVQTGFLPEYQAKHINIWSQEAKRWLQMDRWALCEPAPELGVDQRQLAVAREAALNGKSCSGGLDLSTKLDLTSLVLEFPLGGDVVELLCRFWLPEAEVKRQAMKGRRHYEGWQREGWLTVTPGEVVDYGFIRKEINELAKRYQLKEVGFDPYKATQLVTELRDQDGIQMVDVRQGYLSMSAPCDDLEAKVVQKVVRHMNNPILRWCAANCIVARDPAGNIKPDKATSQGKIDGIVAWAMARSRNMVNVKKTSVYESRGFRQL
jgi:phage terminase large subunit-like protein